MALPKLRKRRNPRNFSRGTTSSFIRDGENGFISENDIGVFVQTVVSALFEREKFERIGAEAQRTLCRTWESIMEDITTRYRTILEK